MKKRMLLLLLLVSLCACGTKYTADSEENAGTAALKVEDVTFSVNKAEIKTEVKPAKPNGYYHYYEKQMGYSYLVIEGKAENKGLYELDADNIILCGKLNDTEYEGKLQFANPAESDLVKKLERNEKQTFYFIILIKDEQEVPDTIVLYYNRKFEQTKRNGRYDKSVSWKLPPLKEKVR